MAYLVSVVAQMRGWSQFQPDIGKKGVPNEALVLSKIVHCSVCKFQEARQIQLGVTSMVEVWDSPD
jgi:hypothetical protein